MLKKENPRSYKEFNNEEDENEGQTPGFFNDDTEDLQQEKEKNDNISQEGDTGIGSSMRFSKLCLKNVFTMVLILIYLLLTGVAVLLAYQTISDFLDKVHNPVMSVAYREVDSFSAPGIALYPGNAQLLSCKHHLHERIPPLVDPGKPQKGDCVVEDVTYYGHFSNETERRTLVVRGPSDVRNKELIFMQLSQNETDKDFSAISYMLFARFSDLANSKNKSDFMRDCERNYSMWTFSGGFRTWVKMSLVRTSGKNKKTIEFRQESTVVKFNDKRPESEQTNELFFAVFEWRDPFMQEIRLIVTANPWNSVAILCGVFMALFKVANFTKLTIQWIIRMRKRHLRNKARELNQVE